MFIDKNRWTYCILKQISFEYKIVPRLISNNLYHYAIENHSRSIISLLALLFNNQSKKAYSRLLSRI